MGKSQTENSRFDRAISRLIRQSRGFRFSRKDPTLFSVNKLFIIWIFASF